MKISIRVAFIKIKFNLYDIDVNKILGSKKEPHGKKAHSNTSLGIRIMMTLNRYYNDWVCKMLW